MPGSPRTVTIRHARSASARSNSSRKRASSAVRPTSGESIRRSKPAAPGSTSSRRQAATGSDFPLSWSGRNRLGGNGVANELDRRVADEDLAAAGAHLEALCHDDGVPGRERIAVRRIAREDLAGVDPGADVDPHAVGPLELVVEMGQLIAQLDRGAHGPERIVLVHDRDPERGHNGIADELLDRAAVPFEHLARGLVIARPHAAQRFRVEPLAERGRIGHVAEDKRDGLPDHEASLGRP